MSKPMTRVAVSVLIGLVIAVTMFTIAYGASGHAGLAGGRVPANAGLTAVVGSNRQPIIQFYNANVERPHRHHCDSDYMAPDD